MSQVVNLYSIFDVKVESYVSPFPALDNNSATILFGKLVASDLSPFYEKAADTLLFLVGSFDDSTGALVACQSKLITTGTAALDLYKAAEAREKLSLAGAASPSSSEDGNKCPSAGTAEDCSHDGSEQGLSN